MHLSATFIRRARSGSRRAVTQRDSLPRVPLALYCRIGFSIKLFVYLFGSIPKSHSGAPQASQVARPWPLHRSVGRTRDRGSRGDGTIPILSWVRPLAARLHRGSGEVHANNRQPPDADDQVENMTAEALDLRQLQRPEGDEQRCQIRPAQIESAASAATACLHSPCRTQAI
jgi:hypothetical protein